MSVNEKKSENNTAACKAVNSRIGGQAVMEGIMMRNDDRYAISVRKPDQNIETKVESTGSLANNKWLKIPIVRGVYSFISSLVTGISCLMFSATFFEEEEETVKKPLTKEEEEAKAKKKEKEDKLLITGTLIVAIALAVGIFMALPYFLMHLLERRVSQTWILSLFESIVRVVIFLVYIILISRMKDIQRTFMYHGAEHKCINCVEHGLPLNIENVMKSSRFHKRCGTSFLFFVVIVSAVFLMLIQAESHVTRLVIRLALIPVIAGVSYEIIRFAGSSNNKFVNLLSKPGLAIQNFTTREPDESMAEVAITAVEAVFDWRAFLKEKFGLDVPKWTCRQAAMNLSVEFRRAGVPEAYPAARAIVMYAVGASSLKEYAAVMNDVLTDTKRLEIEGLAKRRLNGEPVQYITGSADFYGRAFHVEPGVLIPRFDTENLVSRALELCSENDSVLDLCTGSGCIIVSLCCENKTLRGTGSDISDKALAAARKNAEKYSAGCAFVKSDLFENIDGKYDMIVSNPPYIRTADIQNLETEVKDHEPAAALDGGPDGLKYYRRIAAEAPAYLNAGGRLCLEIGFDQAEEVKQILEDTGFVRIEVSRDIAGNERVITCALPGEEETMEEPQTQEILPEEDDVR
ncbi:MAG: peptide chain release factor N(5)-glutamine methyltransferase [Lachnospiraceae bacterium]|nr:peptide chain release factor N(5)-glutamine methyltransferase [Lachnospiraceae bacterium]